MKLKNHIQLRNIFCYLQLFLLLFILVASISCSKWKTFEKRRSDSAVILDIDLKGSLQNPAFSPDGKTIVFTRFKKGYNKGEADLYLYNLNTKELKPLVSDNGTNVNLPGSSWNPVINAIVFSSERGDSHDEIYMIAATGNSGDETQITKRSDKQCYEPSFSPDGEWVVFESHPADVEDQGIITKFKLDGSSGYIDLSSSSENLKQPNWSPAGDKILYQKQAENDQWDIWIMDTAGTGKTQITFNGESTDACFSLDGNWIFYSSGGEDIKVANIFKIPASGGTPTQITKSDDYDGAPSVSPDQTKVAFEGYPKDPDKKKGTKICVIGI